MLDRMTMIGEIRDMLPKLWEAGRFELAKEIMGGVHQDDFTGVSLPAVREIWWSLSVALTMDQDDGTA